MTDNADSGAEGPRWPLAPDEINRMQLQFIGRAGPIDLWVDTHDISIPFLLIYGAPLPTHNNWAGSPERIIQRCQHERIHLTLHDECIIHQLCEAHNRTTKTNPTTTETSDD